MFSLQLTRLTGSLGCPEHRHLFRVSWILGLTSLLLSTCSPGAQGSTVQAPGADLPLKRVRGASVLFHVSRDVGAELEEITWSVGPESNYTNMLQVHRGQEDAPTWVNLRDKYEHRVHVPNMMSLEIENLSPEDSGWYRAQAQLPGGRRSDQGFQLTVYEPAPLPQIVTKSASITSGWCNITLECSTAGDREHLSVRWESNFSLMMSPPGPAPSSWVLAVSLPLPQPNASLTCVVSNPVDQKTRSTALEEVCVPDSPGPRTKDRLPAVLVPIAVVLCIVPAGLYFWKTRGKKKKKAMGRGTAPPEVPEDHADEVQYVELNQPESWERQHQGIGGHHLEEKESLSTVYSEVHDPGQAMKIV